MSGGGLGDSGSGIGTMNVGGSRRSGQKFLGGGDSHGSQRSGSENRSGIGLANSGGTIPRAMAVGDGMVPQYSNHMGSKDT